MASGLADFDVRHRTWMLTGGAVAAALAVLGLTEIVVGTSFTTNLKHDHPLRRSIEAFDESLGGSTTIHVMLEADEPDAFKRPENLVALRTVQEWLDAQPEVLGTTSIADHLMTVNRALSQGDPEAFTLPDKKRVVSQLLFFFWHDRLETFVSRDFDAADILVRLPVGPSNYTAGIMDRIEERLIALPKGLRGVVTGDTPIIVRTMDDISWGQAVSLSGATLIIYAILALYFRSIKVAALALLPNALPVLVYFGVLGLSGVTLNVITSLIACIILGIAVDDTIHFLVRYQDERRAMEPGPAAVAALRIVARPVISTTLALCGGFYALTLSGLRHQVEFGWLAVAMMLFALAVDLLFTPALATFLARRPGPT